MLVTQTGRVMAARGCELDEDGQVFILIRHRIVKRKEFHYHHVTEQRFSLEGAVDVAERLGLAGLASHVDAEIKRVDDQEDKDISNGEMDDFLNSPLY